MKRKLLVTGVAGFIGYHVAKKLIEDENNTVIGIDNLNDYYSIELKKKRIENIKTNDKYNNFSFQYCDISTAQSLKDLFIENNFETVIHLAAQAGVRYSLINPDAYIRSNIVGFTNILECCRHHKIKHLIYASSSSVYGSNTTLPFTEEQSVDHPISLYAATKKSNELMAHTYSHLFSLPTTGLRFFTVYGPWGRPDMAMFLFANAISNSTPLDLFNGGEMLRDFTYVDDVAECILRLCELPPTEIHEHSVQFAPYYRILNIGNNQPELVLNVVRKIENYFKKNAIIITKSIQPGDVHSTYANIESIFKLTGFHPKTSIDSGILNFLNWYSSYHNLSLNSKI
ncbi:NAD-dependent epimerase/dehydratase family protein [Fluviispira multicolorata]|uniref:NAD-dependent epimerase/dehydratase family protein n=1 Tax=Fluviispira multicolorata TaxID=2654512 RepID=A0A833JCX4_9BACT|nr:NAD-dependent epimerase/dehydratase family protein [Fluviispira multicolorata]KAB8028003.1 NAD-dependent epimerase/dehydratase family protein [Fluviispira multicolorata]